MALAGKDKQIIDLSNELHFLKMKKNCNYRIKLLNVSRKTCLVIMR